jgi:hypothetical protein
MDMGGVEAMRRIHHVIAGRHGRRKVSKSDHYRRAVGYLNIWIAPIEALAGIREKSVRKPSPGRLRV